MFPHKPLCTKLHSSDTHANMTEAMSRLAQSEPADLRASESRLEQSHLLQQHHYAILRLEHENCRLQKIVEEQKEMLEQYIERAMLSEQDTRAQLQHLSGRLSETERDALQHRLTPHGLHTVTSSTGWRPQTNRPASHPADCSIEFEGVAPLFYRNNTFPEVLVRVNGDSGEGLRVRINLWNHFDQSLLTGATDDFPVKDGVAHISGLRFMEVSSKHGKYYNLSATLLNKRGEKLATCRSCRIEIKSERLKREKPKSDVRLSPNDHIERMPRIGKQYSTRLREQGIISIKDLAEVTDEHMVEVLNTVRKHRGLMTQETFLDMREKARRTLERHEGSIVVESEMSEEPEHGSKRIHLVGAWDKSSPVKLASISMCQQTTATDTSAFD